MAGSGADPPPPYSSFAGFGGQASVAVRTEAESRTAAGLRHSRQRHRQRHHEPGLSIQLQFRNKRPLDPEATPDPVCTPANTSSSSGRRRAERSCEFSPRSWERTSGGSAAARWRSAACGRRSSSAQRGRRSRSHPRRADSRASEELLDEVYRVVEVVVVHVADVDVNLAAQLLAEALVPVAAQDVGEVVVLAPVGSNLRSISPVSLSQIRFGYPSSPTGE
jgi:hypothetical protein